MYPFRYANVPLGVYVPQFGKPCPTTCLQLSFWPAQDMHEIVILMLPLQHFFKLIAHHVCLKNFDDCGRQITEFNSKITLKHTETWLVHTLSLVRSAAGHLAVSRSGWRTIKGNHNTTRCKTTVSLRWLHKKTGWEVLDQSSDQANSHKRPRLRAESQRGF